MVFSKVFSVSCIAPLSFYVPFSAIQVFLIQTRHIDKRIFGKYIECSFMTS